jgi:hypothetical protein
VTLKIRGNVLATRTRVNTGQTFEELNSLLGLTLLSGFTPSTRGISFLIFEYLV